MKLNIIPEGFISASKGVEIGLRRASSGLEKESESFEGLQSGLRKAPNKFERGFKAA